MQIYNFFGYTFNGLEFTTYFVIPAAIFLMIVVYIGANYRLIKIASELNNEILNGINSDDFHYDNYGIEYVEPKKIEDDERKKLEENNIKSAQEIAEENRKKLQASLKIK